MFMMTATAGDRLRPETASPMPVPTFAHLSPDEWHVFLGYGQTTTAPAGTLLCARGTEQDCLYVVQTGSLLATEAATDVSVSDATRVTAGQVVGETAFLDGSRRDTQLTTETYAEVWSLRSRQFDTLLQDHPRIAGKVALGLAKLLSSRQRTAPTAAPISESRQPTPFYSRSVADLSWA